jgi:hypothetical protein
LELTAADFVAPIFVLAAFIAVEGAPAAGLAIAGLPLVEAAFVFAAPGDDLTAVDFTAVWLDV